MDKVFFPDPGFLSAYAEGLPFLDFKYGRVYAVLSLIFPHLIRIYRRNVRNQIQEGVIQSQRIQEGKKVGKGEALSLAILETADGEQGNPGLLMQLPL